ncbi:sodium:alanine symporter family protein [bacterium]|nr:sodium:alanine symporter family protein [bacterium]
MIEISIRAAATWLWGPPMLIVLFLVGFYFTIKLKGLQFTSLLQAGRLTCRKQHAEGEGNITPLQSLFSALGGLIGNGNIAGAATALYMGGPGALFWLWVGAFIGMIIVYAETFLALNNREKSIDGTFSGGPMYYIRNILKMKWLAALFALAMGFKTLLATSTVQSNSISLAASTVFQLSWLPEWVPPQLPFCLLLALLTWLVIIGGLHSIARTLEKMTPLMVIIYISLGLIIIVVNGDMLIGALGMVLKSAFTPASMSGGFTGATVMMAIRYGIARGFYSNEAGTGSSPIMYSTAQIDNPHSQSLIAMFGVLIDTVVATFTFLIILVSGVWDSGLTSTALTTSAFNTVFGNVGSYIMVLASFLFGYSTLIVWSFYGEQCFAYIWGPRIRKGFRWAFSVAIIFGFMKVELVWSIGDFLNATTILINLAALLFMIHHVVKNK